MTPARRGGSRAFALRRRVATASRDYAPWLHRGIASVTDRIVALPTGAPVGLRGGLLSGDDLPVVLVVLLGADAAAVELLAQRLAGVQALVGGIRPVVLVDTPAFAPLRRRRFPAEYAIARSAWSASPAGESWPEYLRGRIAECRATYDASVVVMCPEGNPPSVQLLAAAVPEAAAAENRGAASGMPAPARRAARALQRWIDRSA